MAPVDGSYTVSCLPLLGLEELPLLVSMPVTRRTNECEYMSVNKRQRVALQDVSHVVNLQHLPPSQQILPQRLAEPAPAASSADSAPKRDQEGTTTPALPADAAAAHHQKQQPQPHPDHEYLLILLEREVQHRSTSPRVHQHEVTNQMRMILVDWLVEVNQEFRLSTDTLHLAISIVDRYIHAQPISKQNLQLLGITSLWIAAKFEEVHPPSIRDCVEFTDNCYSPRHLVQMEYQILNVINFQLALPTTAHFVREILAAAHIPDPQTASLTNYLAELVLLHGSLLHHLPSEVAAAAICVARGMIDPKAPIPAPLLALCGYTPDHILPSIHTIATLHKWACSVAKPPAVKCKYQDTKLYSVASIAYSHHAFGPTQSLPHPIKPSPSAHPVCQPALPSSYPLKAPHPTCHPTQPRPLHSYPCQPHPCHSYPSQPHPSHPHSSHPHPSHLHPSQFPHC